MDINNFPQPKRVLVVVAHPDDPDFGAAGTVARWTQEKVDVTYLIVTDGAKGSSDPEMTSEKLTQIRQKEQKAAAKVVGVRKVEFLGYPDGGTYNTPELRKDLTRKIREHRPDLVITHDPTSRFFENRFLNHPDHRAVGDTLLDVVYPIARDRLNYPEHEEEGLQPHKVLDVFLTGSNHPNMWVDIGETMDLKIQALRQHKSQFDDLDALEARVREFARERAGKVSFEYTEVFRRVQLPR